MISKANFYCDIGEYKKALDVLSVLVNEGFACENDIFDMLPLNEKSNYINIKAKNDLLLKKEAKNTKLKYSIHFPNNYDEEKKYPLFIALHGNPGNINEFSEYWKVDEFLKKDFIVLYTQSSQLYQHNGFVWLKNPLRAREDIKKCYNEVLKKHSIDEKCVLIGGFSGGAITALDITFSNVIPIKGFIAIGPETPESFTKENVKAAVERGIRGVFMEGEIIMPVKEQEDMIKVFQELGFKYEFYINEGIGHAIPVDLDKKLNDALNFICSFKKNQFIKISFIKG